jgi:hypothetical protein
MLLGETCSAVGLDYLCCMVTMVTKLFNICLWRESRHISSCQNFLFIWILILFFNLRHSYQVVSTLQNNELQFYPHFSSLLHVLHTLEISSSWSDHLNNWRRVKNYKAVRFQVLTVARMKIITFWDIAPCSLVVADRRFRCVLPPSSWWWRQYEVQDYMTLYPRRLASSIITPIIMQF